MSTLVVEGWSMTTGGGGPKSEELACGGMKGGMLCWKVVMCWWVGQQLPAEPLMG